MKLNKIKWEVVGPTLIRLSLTALLGLGVYSETGVWTTVWYVLMVGYVEVQAYNQQHN